MERAVHSEPAKRVVRREDSSGLSSLAHMTSTLLVRNTGAGVGHRTPQSRRKTDVTILDVYENAASVKIVTGDFVDYLHLTRWNGEWKILNVLTEMHPAPVK
jgi:predicted nucleic acid-binding protein